ncbi:MAG: ferrous iron transport protein B [Promethearchaeota archaeon]
MSCCNPNKKQKKNPKKCTEDLSNIKGFINIALAGNPNVGKSVIFNQLTGLSQTIGNWPGKTVELMEGYLDFLGYRFKIVDLPGIYSLSTFSLEEIVSREYIVSEDVDLIINVIDVTNLERNLFFTFQLLELKVPMILAVNQMDILRKRNLDIDFKKMEDIFKLPAIPVVAVHGVGVHQLLEEAIELIMYKETQPHYHEEDEIKKLTEKRHKEIHLKETPLEREKIKEIKSKFKFPDLSDILSYGKEVESKIKILTNDIDEKRHLLENCNYPSRFLAIKLLENDEEIKKLCINITEFKPILEKVEKFRSELEEIHGEDINTIISSEIYNNIRKVVDQILIRPSKKSVKKSSFADKIDHITTHSVWGYVILILVLIGIYTFTFAIGDFFGGLIDEFYGIISDEVYTVYGRDNLMIKIFWDGGMGGLFGGIGGVLVYVIPFFLVIEILQDSGYLPRAAFLMDKFMHALGAHGKTIITMILGFGCNVPACAGCRIMETEREKKISIALTSLIPCAAVMTVVLGLVGRYLGLYWVLFLFLINFIVIIIVGKILNKVMPGQCVELIMELHEYRAPNVNVILKQTWVRTKEFVYKAMPIIIILGMILEILFEFRLLDPINIVLSPVTVFWLGLPLITGVFLIYGILRKELTLVLLGVLAASLQLSITDLLTPVQMITFCLVTMLYIPCFATIVIIAKNTSWKYALQISGLEISIALLIGGAVNWILLLLFSL